MGSYRLKVDRHEAIRAAIQERSSVSLADLINLLGVSEATVRRDLDELERSGVLQRTHGGAVAADQLPYPLRETINVRHKQAIATAAREFVHVGSTIFLGGGSTTLQVAPLIRSLDVTVITNSLPIAMHLAEGRARVVVIGGALRTPELSMVGPRAAAAIGAYRAETALLGVPAIDGDYGFTADGDAEAATDAAFVAMSKRTIVLADHTKLGRVSSTPVVPLSAIDTIVTDSDASDSALASLRQHGADVIVAEVGR